MSKGNAWQLYRENPFWMDRYQESMAASLIRREVNYATINTAHVESRSNWMATKWKANL